jgi:hypothetical protein
MVVIVDAELPASDDIDVLNQSFGLMGQNASFGKNLVIGCPGQSVQLRFGEHPKVRHGTQVSSNLRLHCDLSGRQAHGVSFTVSA